MIEFLAVFLIAVGLSMDALAATIASTLCTPGAKRRQGALMAFSFGLFQGGMPVLGWLAGRELEQYITAFDHWIAALLLGYLGLRMVIGALEVKEEKECDSAFSPKSILTLSVATSIDALCVGLSFAFIGSSILLPALIIGVVTFLACFGGFCVARCAKSFPVKKAEIAGGVVLIVIGIKILIEHLFF